MTIGGATRVVVSDVASGSVQNHSGCVLLYPHTGNDLTIFVIYRHQALRRPVVQLSIQVGVQFCVEPLFTEVDSVIP